MKPSERFEYHLKSKAPEGFFVYVLIDPRSKSVFYVGKGKGQRITSHFYSYNLKNCKNKKRNKIISINNAEFKVLARVILTGLDEGTALKYEYRIIRYFKKCGCDLTNVFTDFISHANSIDNCQVKNSKSNEELVKLFKLRFMYERIDFRDLIKEEPFCSSGLSDRTFRKWLEKDNSSYDYVLSECPTQSERMIENIIFTRKMRSMGTSDEVIVEILNIPLVRVKQYLKDSTLKRYGVYEKVIEELSNGTFKRL